MGWGLGKGSHITEKGGQDMATLAPSRMATILGACNDGPERLAAALRPWQRRLMLQQTARWLGIGLLSGLFLACLLLLVSRLVPWGGAPYWAGATALACVLCALFAAFWYRPTLPRTARLVDTRLSLHDRLGTAWEMRYETAALPTLQRRDALQQLDRHTPAAAISLRPRRSRLILFAIVVIALALLVLLPNPMTAVLKQQAAFQARISKQIAAIEHVRLATDQQSQLTSQQRAAIDQILRQLEANLKNAKNETQAQQAIANAQAKLNQLQNPQAANQQQANQNASASLQSSGNQSLNQIGQALANGNSNQLQSSLQNLANELSKMTPQQRQQIAQQLAQAANSATQDPALSSALQQLSKAVASGDQNDVSSAINAVENAASQEAATQAQTNSINRTSQALQQSANALASSTDSTTSQNQTAQGQGQQSQQGQGQNQGQGQGQNQGQGQGKGQGQGQGQGQNQGQGQGGQGTGGTNGNNSSGNQSGKNEQVTVPGQIGSGNSTESNGGNSTSVQTGHPVAYSQVIAQYAQQAHDAIDNSSISPDLKDLVSGYFNNLEGQ